MPRGPIEGPTTKIENQEEFKGLNINDADIIEKLGKVAGREFTESQIREFLSIKELLKEGGHDSHEFYIGGSVDKFFVGGDGKVVIGARATEEARKRAQEVGMI